MSVEVKIGGGDPSDRITAYSITEEATPRVVTDMAGGVGQLTVNLEHSKDVLYSRHREVILTDSKLGEYVGRGVSVGTNDFQATLTADSRMVALVAERTIPPMDGTPGFLFEELLKLAGITTGVVVHPSTLTGPTYAIPGDRAVVWDQVKRLCSANQLEVALIRGTITLRPIRQNWVTSERDSSWQRLIDDSQIAQKIILHYNRDSEVRADLLFPLGGWKPETQVFSIDAGATEEFEIKLRPTEDGQGVSIPDTSLAMMQPICVDYVGREVSNQSVYCVAGNDGKPITAAQWNATGGKIEVSIGEDTQSLKVKIIGSGIEEYAPYRIAATAGPSDYYSSLRIYGVGVFYERKKLELFTGNSPDIAPTEVGAEVENLYLVSDERAYRAGHDALHAWVGPTLGLNITSVEPLELGASADQQFGNIAGAMIDVGAFKARVKSATITQSTVQYQAEDDLTLDDWEAHYGELTLDQFDALVGDELTLDELAIEPLL